MKILLSLLMLAQLMIGGGRVGTAINGFSFCRPYRADHTRVPNTLTPIESYTDFPSLFSSTVDPGLQNDLRTVANGGLVTNEFGYDVIIYPDALGGAGGAKLDHEIDTYDPVTGVFIAHFRKAISALVDVVVYVCGGKASITTSQQNKTGVWLFEYKAVYHFRTIDGSLDVTDSTVNNLGGKAFGTTTITPGKIGGAALFINPAEDFVNIGAPGFEFSGNRTFEFWYHLNAAPMPSSDSPKFGIYKKVGVSSGTEISITNRVGPGCRAEFSSGTEGSAQISENVEAFVGDTKHCAVVYNRDTHKIHLYVNGLAGETYDYYPPALNTEDTDYIGYGMNGWIDETRASSVARSHDWIKGSYLQQSNPALIWSSGPRL